MKMRSSIRIGPALSVLIVPLPAQDYLDILEPRHEWKFRALVLDPKTTAARVSAIKEME